MQQASAEHEAMSSGPVVLRDNAAAAAAAAALCVFEDKLGAGGAELQ